MQGPGGYSETYSYDDLGRPMKKTTGIAGESFSVTTGYDVLSRVSTITDPTGFTVQNVYTDRGHLREVRNTADQRLYWRAESINARGQLEQFTLGNQVRTERGFDATTGFLQTVHSVAGASGGTVQDLEYGFDGVGNLLERADRLQGLAETFTYDALNRLTQAQVGGRDAVTLDYDAVGNILSKSDVGSYTYGEGGAGPHAVTSISGLHDIAYEYDANGNRVTSSRSQPAALPFADGFESGDLSAWETAAPGAVEGEASTVTYSSFNMPTVIAAADATVSFQYGPGRGRFRKTVEVQGKRTVTLYIDGIYERESFEQGAARHKHYIAAGNALVAVHTTRNGEPDRTRYLHKDHLGSIDAVTDESGAVVERLSFDAWGRRRNAVDWGPATGVVASAVNRGYTGHEMLDEVGLIHMNGRVYDPEIGRFLSPDPVVQTPEDGQSLNRYSYVLNNPLSYTDPSGYFFKKLFESIKKFFSGNKVGLIGAVVGITVGFWASGGIVGLFGFKSISAAVSSLATTATATQASSALFAAAVGGGFAGGFAGSAASTLAAGGSLSDALRAGARGGAFGALSGGVFNQIGGLYLPHIPKVLAHGAAGGALSLAQGGKFEHGFLSSAANALLAPRIEGLGDGQPDSEPYCVAAAAIVGGSVAEISGGKFANGAVTAAFARLFNERFHGMSKKEFVEYLRSQGLRPGEHLRIADDLADLPSAVLLEPSRDWIEWFAVNTGNHLFNHRIPGTNFHITLEEGRYGGVFVHYDMFSPVTRQNRIIGIVGHGVEVLIAGENPPRFDYSTIMSY